MLSVAGESALPKAEATIVLAPDAEQDLDAIWYYYAANTSLDLADRLVANIESCIERLRAYPLSGAPRSRFAAGLRAVKASPYLVFYRINPKQIEVVRILHERRDYEAAFSEDEP